MGGGIDPERAGQLAAVAARQGVGVDAACVQQAQDLAGDRGLARAADGQVADEMTGTPGSTGVARAMRRAVAAAQIQDSGLQQGAGDAAVAAVARDTTSGGVDSFIGAARGRQQRLRARPTAGRDPRPASAAARRARSPMARAAAGSFSSGATTPGRSPGVATTVRPPAATRAAVTACQFEASGPVDGGLAQAGGLQRIVAAPGLAAQRRSRTSRP